MPRSFLDILTQSVIPRSVTDPVLDKVAQPGLNTTAPMAALRGLLAGSSQGALDTFTNPISLLSGGAGAITRLLGPATTAAAEAAPTVGRLARAAKPVAAVVDDLDTQIAAIEHELTATKNMANSLAAGPHWFAGSMGEQVKSLQDELKTLQAIKTSRGIEDAQAAAEAADQAAFRALRNAASKAPKSASQKPSLTILNPEASAAEEYTGNAAETDALIKVMRQRLGLPEEVPQITKVTGQRTSQKPNIYK